jgi:hypothetical protein
MRCHRRGLRCGPKELTFRRRSERTAHDPSGHQDHSSSPRTGEPESPTIDRRLSFLEWTGTNLSRELLQQPLPPSLQADQLSARAGRFEQENPSLNMIQIFGMVRHSMIQDMRNPQQTQASPPQAPTPGANPFTVPGIGMGAVRNDPYPPPYPQDMGIGGEATAIFPRRNTSNAFPGPSNNYLPTSSTTEDTPTIQSSYSPCLQT